MIEIPNGWRNSAPVPKANANGQAPNNAARIVIMIRTEAQTGFPDRLQRCQ